MSYASLTLVIMAAMAHATWNLLAKRAAMVGPVFVFAHHPLAAPAHSTPA